MRCYLIADGSLRPQRDATLISVLAYAGLRPGEALALRWGDIRERTLLVQRSVSYGEAKGTKTNANRTVRLLGPLRLDLAGWRLASGRPGEHALVFPAEDGLPWSKPAYQSWRRRAFRRALEAANVQHARPYDLRHSFASLLLHEGRSVDLCRAPAWTRRAAHAEQVRARDRRAGRHAARRCRGRDQGRTRSAMFLLVPRGRSRMRDLMGSTTKNITICRPFR